MAYIKRQNIGKFWPIPRKGTKYLAVSTHNKKSSIPLIVVMRDILKLVENSKELKKVLHEKKIMINSKEIKEVNYPVELFDVISVSGKNYRAVLSEKKKMVFDEVSEKEAGLKVIKIIGKRVLGKDVIQVNLMDGRNVILKDEVKTGDSVVYNSREKKVDGIIKMEKGKVGFVFEGKHAGNKGKIEEIIERGGKRLVKIVTEGKKGEKINVWVKNVIVME